MGKPDTMGGFLSGSQRRPQFAWRAANFDLVLPGFIVLLAATAAIAEPRFLSAGNLANLARQLVPLLILSVGQALAIIAGGLDLSLASVLSVAGIVGVLGMPEIGVAGGIGLMAATGATCGLFSGAIIAYTGSSPLIVTLATLSITQAIALILANGVPIYDVPSAFTDSVGFSSIGYIPITVLIGVATLCFFWFVLRLTVFGRYIYAIGSSRSAALHSGVNVRFYTVLVYVASGLCAGIGAIVVTAWTGAAQPIAQPTLTLESLAAVVLGGVALTGGSGGMLHVIFGVVILGTLSNMMNMIGISAYYQTLAVGIVILIAVCLDRYRHRASRK